MGLDDSVHFQNPEASKKWSDGGDITKESKRLFSKILSIFRWVGDPSHFSLQYYLKSFYNFSYICLYFRTHNNLVTILKTQSFNIDNYTDIYTSGNELSPKLRPRGAYQVERERPKSTTFNIEQNNNNNNSISTNGGVEQLSLSHSFPRNTLSFSPQTRALLVGSSSSPVVPNGHHHHHSSNHHAPISPVSIFMSINKNAYLLIVLHYKNV